MLKGHFVGRLYTVCFVSKIISWSFICQLYCNYFALESVILANVICQPLNRLRILACFEPATTTLLQMMKTNNPHMCPKSLADGLYISMKEHNTCMRMYMYHTYHILKACKAEVLLMNIFKVCGYVLYYGLFLHSKNHFSYDGTQLLKERAKSIRPRMVLRIDGLTTTDALPPTDVQNR